MRKPAVVTHESGNAGRLAAAWVLKTVGISKLYGGVVANVDVSLDLKAGEIHAVLGENGAGKSTIMKIIYAMELPDAGHIELDGHVLALRSPRDAIDAGIGMVHQHFMLVPTLTVLENLILGTRFAGRFIVGRRKARAEVSALSRRYRIDVELDRLVGQLSIGEQQRVEVLKALLRGARALILDEPTAVLTPQEIAALGTTLRELASEGHGIFIVTHKLEEVMDISDRISVMRQGRHVGTWRTADTTIDALVTQMVGRTLKEALPRGVSHPGRPILALRNVKATGDDNRRGLQGVNLEIAAGEIVGLAGVEGNGQRELAEVITGLRHVDSGDVILDGAVITNRHTDQIFRAGIAHIPEDRHRDGAVLDFSVADNAILVNHASKHLQRTGIIDRRQVKQFADQLISEFMIRCSGSDAPMRSLSGGNQQKLVLGRELARDPKLLIAMQPTRGLDVSAIEYVHSRLIEGRSLGMAILLVSNELDEILALSDRIAVLRNGRIVSVLERGQASADTVGALMLGASGKADKAA